MEDGENFSENTKRDNIIFANFKKRFEYTDSEGNKGEVFIYVQKGDINIEFPEDLYWFNSLEGFRELIKKKNITFSPESEEEIIELAKRDGDSSYGKREK